MTDNEIEQVIQSAILNAETVEYDRACTPKDHADSAAEIADLERLGVFAKAAREIVQKVATTNVLSYEGDAGDNVGCPFCWGEEDWRAAEQPIDGKFIHEPTCTVLKARAILTAESQGSGNAE